MMGTNVRHHQKFLKERFALASVLGQPPSNSDGNKNSVFLSGQTSVKHLYKRKVNPEPMGYTWKQLLINPTWTQSLPLQLVEIWQQWLKNPIDILLVVILTYMVLIIIGERRTLWMVRGFIALMVAAAVSTKLELRLLSFVLNNLVTGSAVAMAVLLQSEFRRLLEQLGKGELLQLFKSSRPAIPKSDTVIDQIVEAVKELSQNRTGALMILETSEPIDERDFSVPGVRLNAEVSKELLQTLFQTSTLLHDGAVLIREARIMAAGVILPLSERKASRQLGTRHRAAMGITERVEHCICVVVSEETGSISLAEKGVLNRPLTSSKLKELLEARFSQSADREVVAPDLRQIMRKLGSSGVALLVRLLRLPSSASSREKK